MSRAGKVWNVHTKKSFYPNFDNTWTSLFTNPLSLGNSFCYSNAVIKNVGQCIFSILANLVFLFCKCSSILPYGIIILFNSCICKLLYFKNNQIKPFPYYLFKYFSYCPLCLVSLYIFGSGKLNFFYSFPDVL